MEKRQEKGNGTKTNGHINQFEYLANKFSTICRAATQLLGRHPTLSYKTTREKPFGSHSFSFFQNALGSKKEAGVHTISHLLIVSHTDPPDFISSTANTTGLEIRLESHWRNVQKLQSFCRKRKRQKILCDSFCCSPWLFLMVKLGLLSISGMRR